MPAPDAAAPDPYPPAPKTVDDAKKLDPSVYEPAAKAGDMEAAFRLGLIYWGHKKFGAADHWWHIAADHGHVDAMYWLGNAAEVRSFMPGKAVKLLTRAADAGSVDAMVELAQHYDDAMRDGHHRPDAMRWWTAAAQAGRVGAMVRVAELATDRDQALPWLHRAAEAGSADALAHLAVDARDHGDVAGAIGWWHQAADAGDKASALHAWSFTDDHVTLARAVDGGDHEAEAQFGGLAYDAGDLELAHLVLDRAADAGQTTAMRRLAHLLEFHDGDGATAGHLLVKASKAGDLEATCDLGNYITRHAPKESAGIDDAYRRPANAGITRAMVKLGDFLGGQSDEALGWYRKAADAGDGDGWCRLGDDAERKGDHDGAARLWQRGADAGSGQALTRLAAAADTRGDADAAGALWAQAAEHGSKEAALELARRARDAGDQAAVDRWTARAADLDPVPPDALSADEKRDLAYGVLGGAALIADIVSD